MGIEKLYKHRDILAMVIWNATLLLLMIPSNYAVSAIGLFVLGRLPEEKRADAKKRLARLAIVVSSVVWRLALKLCPWIQLDTEGLETYQAELRSSGRPVLLIANHSSFFDIILQVVLLPMAEASRIKMTVSDHVGKMPMVGQIVMAMDHPQIPFKSQKANEFEVDREGSNKAMERMAQHVKEGGNLGWFPEGTINREDFHTLKMFRAGGFQHAVTIDMEIWCCVTVGNPLCWHPKKPVGGRPCRIGIKIFKLCDSTFALCADVAGEACTPELDKAKREFIANHAHEKMQEALNNLVAGGYTSFRDKGLPGTKQ